MCGIVGFIGPYQQQDLKAMMSLMSHRGPDGEGQVFTSDPERGNLGIGHRRLSIIDLAGGTQPIWNEDRSIAITFNGEIYNYQPLRQGLQEAGHVFATQSDTEVILHGYEEYGEEVVEKLEGMFAFGIWDSRNRTFFLARDRFGIKPLYYMVNGDSEIVFASEIKPLLYLKKSRNLNLEAFYHFLLYGWISTEETIFKGVYQLLSGHTLTFGKGAKSIRRYWKLRLSEQSLSFDKWAEILRERLFQAVQSHLIADVPVGITLSGGLDSSSILALMARVVPQEQIQAFTISYGREDDETQYSRKSAAHMQVVAKERKISLAQVRDAFAQMIWHLEEPLAHPVLGTTFFLAQFAAEKLKVVLIGEGSDELFAGYPHFRLLSWPYNLAPRPILRHYFLSAATLMPGPRDLSKFLNPDMLDPKLLAAASRAYDGYLRQQDLAQGGMLWELENELVYNQLARIDKLTMAHSLEARVPFLDHNFAEAAFNVPFSFKAKNGLNKYILRQAMRDLLPQEVALRPKSGPGGTQALMPALVDTLLASEAGVFLSREAIETRGWLRYNAVKRYLAEASSPYVRYHPIESRKRQKFTLALLTLEQWARLFIDGEKDLTHGYD